MAKIYDPRLCAVCGREFTPARKDQVACSPECRLKRQMALSMAKNRIARQARVLPETACAACGQTFRPARLGENCCSAACKAVWRHRAYLAQKQAALVARIAELEKQLAEIRTELNSGV